MIILDKKRIELKGCYTIQLTVDPLNQIKLDK